jgi:hypothetical protein
MVVAMLNTGECKCSCDRFRRHCIAGGLSPLPLPVGVEHRQPDIVWQVFKDIG